MIAHSFSPLISLEDGVNLFLLLFFLKHVFYFPVSITILSRGKPTFPNMLVNKVKKPHKNLVTIPVSELNDNLLAYYLGSHNT